MKSLGYWVSDHAKRAARWVVWSPGRLLLVLAVVLVLGGLAQQLQRHAQARSGPVTATAASSASTARQTASARVTASAPSRASSSASPAVSPSGTAGDALATAWLRAYLTRTSPDDTSWTATVAGMSDPALVAQLRRVGPVALGLPTWGPWTVTKVDPLTVPDQGVSTPTRLVSSWVVTISDGASHSETRGFTVIQYLNDAGGWQVAQVTHLYSSGG